MTHLGKRKGESRDAFCERMVKAILSLPETERQFVIDLFTPADVAELRRRLERGHVSPLPRRRKQ